MKQSIREVLIGVAGCAIGSVITWLLVKDKYEQKVKDEIDSIREAYANINKEAVEKAALAKNKPDISIYTAAIQKTREEPDIPETEVEVESPVYDDEDYLFEITVENYRDYVYKHTQISITRFLDDIYTDEMYNQIDPAEYLNRPLVLLEGGDPVDPIDYIRRTSKDEVIIRNIDAKLDIDIDMEPRTYVDFMST